MKKASDLGITDDMTIKQAKEILRLHVVDGFLCCVCHGHAKMYIRPLSSAMAFALILMYREQQKNPDTLWFKLDDILNPHNMPCSDVPKLRFWSLVEPRKGQRDDGNPNNGYYRITDAGKKFVELKIVVPSHVKLYNNTFFGHPKKSKLINISEALKKKFDYVALMKGELYLN